MTAIEGHHKTLWPSKRSVRQLRPTLVPRARKQVAPSLSARVNSWVVAPVQIDSIAAFRIMFGLLMAAAMLRFIAKGWVRELYTQPRFHFTYPRFEWIHPWSEPLMHAHFILLALLALGIAAGFFYRICITVFFLGFTYVELLDQTAYLNHYYLISLLSGLLILLPANRALSFDVCRKPQMRLAEVPAWCLNILRFQVAVVYIFAGLAKFNSDWLLRAQPLRIWLAARSDLPLLGQWLAQPWVAYGSSWFGALFDTTIVFFLLSRQTRKPAFIVLIVFHVATWLLFNIGMFPWIMIVSATILLPADWPRHFIPKIFPSFDSSKSRGSFDFELPLKKPHPLLLLFLATYAALQIALPLRPYFSSQPSAWTCSGFNCAWQVMIAEKTGYAEFFAFDPATGNRRRLSVKDEITARQQMMMAQDPYLIRQMGLHLATKFGASGVTALEIRAEAFATINGRPSQRLIDPQANLAKEAVSVWIIPLTPTTSNIEGRVARKTLNR
jgi:vitamin K-dependent gamma-carboxylase